MQIWILLSVVVAVFSVPVPETPASTTLLASPDPTAQVVIHDPSRVVAQANAVDLRHVQVAGAVAQKDAVPSITATQLRSEWDVAPAAVVGVPGRVVLPAAAPAVQFTGLQSAVAAPAVRTVAVPVQQTSLSSPVHYSAIAPLQYPSTSLQFAAAPIHYRAAPAQYPATPVQYAAAPIQYQAAHVQHAAAAVQYPAAPVQYAAAAVQYPAAPVQYAAAAVQYPVAPVQYSALEVLPQSVQTNVAVERAHVAVPVTHEVTYGKQQYIAGYSTQVHKPSLSVPAISAPQVFRSKETVLPAEVTIQRQEIPVANAVPVYKEAPYHAGTIVQYTEPQVQQVEVPIAVEKTVPVHKTYTIEKAVPVVEQVPVVERVVAQQPVQAVVQPVQAVVQPVQTVAQQPVQVVAAHVAPVSSVQTIVRQGNLDAGVKKVQVPAQFALTSVQQPGVVELNAVKSGSSATSLANTVVDSWNVAKLADSELKIIPYGAAQEQTLQLPYGAAQGQTLQIPYGAAQGQTLQIPYGAAQGQTLQLPYGAAQGQTLQLQPLTGQFLGFP